MDNKPEISLVEIRKAYYKDWRAKNKDKVKQHNLNFWSKKAQQKKVEAKPDNGTPADNQ